MLDFIGLTDAYKFDHRRQYPTGTTRVYSNWTPRSSRIEGQQAVVFFGLQYFLIAYLTELAGRTFFGAPLDRVVRNYQRRLDACLGPNQIGTDHIAALHDLGYMPLEFCALREGSHVPLRCPMFTVENTVDDFFWVTNYIETLLSCVVWLPCTSATTAYRYRKILDHYAARTGDPSFVDWQGHDFSFRGMACPEAAALSGAGHLLSFTGTDTIPAVELLENYYGGDGLIGGSVAATEHSVMCAGGKETEIDTFRRLLQLYPSGILSVVSDTWDLWAVLGVLLPELKREILARDGKLVIRPDSGDPVKILCGDDAYAAHSSEGRGVVQMLWDVFGGSYNSKGFKVLDPHIGAIYGDSITELRAREICCRLEASGFSSTNVVFGIGSFTYQLVTRDVQAFAVKATWAKVNGLEYHLFKNPVTDSGVKKSARGRIAVVTDAVGRLSMLDDLSENDQALLRDSNLLKPVWKDGKFVASLETLCEIRARVRAG